MAVTDKTLISGILDKKDDLHNLLGEMEDKPHNVEYPVDGEICQELTELSAKLSASDDEFRLFYYSSDVKRLWKLLIEKSIKCLRGFDENEPFLKKKSKSPLAYGISDLEKYFNKYIDFESMLYGSGKYYRDHIIHVFRVWLIGLECMLSREMRYAEQINIDECCNLNIFEKISIWTLISLSHDLGYPLEKAQDIVEKTKGMMKLFIANPTVNMDISFNGVQTNMNDFVLKFMSSKMKASGDDRLPYTARLQPKYYYKFQKSLENYNHGVLSAIILYKLLIYFLESDFSTNEDYNFTKNESRQFYIRREILRAIASHTCTDIYHLNMHSYAFLLIIADDCQGWGRKQISGLYIQPNSTYKLDRVTMDDSNNVDNVCRIEESFEINEKYDKKNDTLKIVIQNILEGIYHQYNNYKIIFRDGPDTDKRDFSLKKTCKIKCTAKKTVDYIVEMNIDKESSSSLVIKIELSSEDSEKGKNDGFGRAFVSKLFSDNSVTCSEEFK